MNKFYSADGRVVRRKIGFSDNPFVFVTEKEEKDNDNSVADLIGQSVSYWSETLECQLDRAKKENK